MKFRALADYFEKLEGVSERLQMTDVLARLLDEAGTDEINHVVYLCQGQLGPAYKSIEIGMSEKFTLSAIKEAANVRTDKTQSTYRDTGDIGLTAEKLVSGREGLAIVDVFNELEDIAGKSGKNSQQLKIGLLANLLKGVSPIEARYIARFVVGKLRLGVGDQTILDAIAQLELNSIISSGKNADEAALNSLVSKVFDASQYESDGYFEKTINGWIEYSPLNAEAKKKLADAKTDEAKAVIKTAKKLYKNLRDLHDHLKGLFEQSYNKHPDLGYIARAYKKHGFKKIRDIEIALDCPVKMALCERLPTSEDIIERLGTAAVEAKYDGLRLQVHIDHNKVDIFSRNLERMTEMFPDITEAAQALPCKTAILEGEALVINEETGELRPFQETMQRRRKHDIEAKRAELPLKLFVFELLYLDGEDYTGRTYTERRKAFEELLKKSRQDTIVTAQMFKTSDPAEIDRHFSEFIETGLEGIVAKRLDAPYTAGARNYNWIKLKRSYRGELADTIDVCIVGYLLGKGQRTKFGLGAVLGAVYDKKTDTFKTVSKIGTGFTEKDLKELERTLSDLKLKHRSPRVDALIEADVWVEPKIILTVTADEITRSPFHTAGIDDTGKGYALRFPRAIQGETGVIRSDKSAEDANSVDEIIKMEKQQKKVKVT